MKKLLLLFTFLVLTTFVKAQDPLPTDTARHIIAPTYSFSFYTRDSSIIMYKGSKYGYTRLISNRKARQLIDSLGRLNANAYKLKIDTITMNGWFSNYKGSLKEDIANKQSNLTASSTKYPTVDAVNTGLGAKPDTSITGQHIRNITTAHGINNLVVKNDSSKYYEKLVNKSTNVTTDGTSDIKYPSAKAVKTFADTSAVANLGRLRAANTYQIKCSYLVAANIAGKLDTAKATFVMRAAWPAKIAPSDTATMLAHYAKITAVNLKEDTTNKVTTLSGGSTDVQYPSAKLVYDQFALKAPLSSPPLTGTPTAPTAGAGTSTTQLATTEFVQVAVRSTPGKEASKYATIAALPAVVYANGSAGVGATLTGVALGALGIDSQSPSVGQRVLVKNQVSTFQNGIYTVTATGSGIAVFVMTRALDFNQQTDVLTGAATYVVGGTTLAGTTWDVNSADSPVIGTDAITFVQRAGPSSVVAGNGITITGTSIAINTAVTADLTSTQTMTGKTIDGVTPTVMGYVDPTSSIQTQLNAKAATAQTMYIGTTAHAINRASASEGLAGITSLTPGANFTLSQNSVAALTSEETGAIVNTLYLKAGNVGIGTTNPGYQYKGTAGFVGTRLSVVSNIADDGIYIGNTNNNNPALQFGSLNASSEQVRTASIFSTMSVLTDGTEQGDLNFWTNGGAGITQAMRIQSNGNVGIGTTNPGYQHRGTAGFVGTRLSVVSNIADDGIYIGNTNNNNPALQFGSLNASSEQVRTASVFSTMSVLTDGTEQGDLNFWTNGGAGITQAMRIQSNGNVGIGTTNPGYQHRGTAGFVGTRLSVVSNIADDGIYIGNTNNNNPALQFGSLNASSEQVR